MFSLDGAPLTNVAGHPGGTDARAFDPSGVLLVSGGQDRSIRVWHREGDVRALDLVPDVGTDQAAGRR